MTVTLPEGEPAPDPRERFEALTEGAGPAASRSRLAEAALWMAAESYPRIDVDHYLALLGALAERARQSVDLAAPLAEQVSQLNHLLFDLERFQGARENYYDPRNSFLNEVLERRVGIPISLSILYIDIALRIGMQASGVGFPGHFLVKVEGRGSEPVLVDAFGAQVLSRADCEGLLQHVLGEGAKLHPAHLAASPPNAILARSLGNLKQIHTQAERFEDALACCERIVRLLPDAPIERRDRGLIYHRLECFSAAVDDLEYFLEQAPEHESAARIEQLLTPLRERVRRLH